MRNLLLALFLINVATSTSKKDCIADTIQAHYKKQFIAQTGHSGNERVLVGFMSGLTGLLNHITGKSENTPKIISNNDEMGPLLHAIEPTDGVETTIEAKNVKNIFPYELIAAYYESLFKSSGGAADVLVNGVCIPHTMNAGVHIIPATYHCNKLIKEGLADADQNIKFMVRYANSGHIVFGQIFAAAIQPMVELYPVEDQKVPFDTSNIPADKVDEHIINHFISIYREQHKKYDRSFAKAFHQGVRALMKSVAEKATLEDFISDTPKTINKVKVEVYLLIGPYTEDIEIEDVKEVLRMNMNLFDGRSQSIDHIFLAEQIIKTMKQKYRNLSNMFYVLLAPQCFQTLAKLNAKSVIDTCKQNLTELFNIKSEKSHEFVSKAVKSKTFYNNLIVLLKDQMEQIDARNIKKGKWLAKAVEVRDAFINKEMLFNAKNFIETTMTADQTALKLDLEDYFEVIPDTVHRYFRLKNEMANYVDVLHAATVLGDIYAYIDQLRENIKNFTESTQDLNNLEFAKKLEAVCRDKFATTDAFICKFASRNVDFTSLLPYKDYEYIYQVLVSRYADEMSKYETNAVNGAVIRAKATAVLNYKVEDLISYINEQALQLRTDMDMAHEQRSNAVVAAIWGQSVSNKDWDGEVVPIMRQWYTDNKFAQNIDNDKLKDYLQDLYNRITAKGDDKEPKLNEIQQVKYQFTPKERKEIIDNIEQVLMTFGNMAEDLQEDLKACQLDESSANEVKETCRKNSRGKRPCRHINNFIITEVCDKGYVMNLQQECVQKCPSNFKAAGDSYCKLPMISSVDESATAVRKCPKLHRRFGNLCMPVCPRGMINMGDVCQRDSYKLKYYVLI